MKTILNEMSPSDILLWGKNVAYPLAKNRFLLTKGSLKSAKRSIGRIINTAQPKGKAIKAEVVRAIGKDPSLYGDVFRAAETARQAGSAYLLQNLPPLPTADVQSLIQTGQGIKALAGDPNASKEMAKRVKKVLTTNPLKQAKHYIVNRATTGTYTGSPITNYSSNLFGITGPVVDNNPIMMAFRKAGIDDQGMIDILNQSKDYYLGTLKNVGRKIKQYSFLGN